MECKCMTCIKKDCLERTEQDDLEFIVGCDDYLDHEPTNADRIRAMSDEELAQQLLLLTDLDDRIHYCKDLPECLKDLYDDVEIPADRCRRCLLSWLQQSAEVDNV